MKLSASKIKIIDNTSLRNDFLSIYEQCDNKTMAIWAIYSANRVLEKVSLSAEIKEQIYQGFYVNEMWQQDKMKVSDIRQAGFNVNSIAKSFDGNGFDDKLKQTVIRCCVHSIATGHMKEHAVVLSDYLVKVNNLMCDCDLESAKKERERQILDLKKVKN